MRFYYFVFTMTGHGKYGLVIVRTIQLAGAVTVLVLGSFIAVMLLRKTVQTPN